MMKIEISSLILSLSAGFFIGVFFFGGLWWTLKKIISSKRAFFWHLGSSLLRLGLALTGFYFVGQGNWINLILCLIGFIGARFAVTQCLKESINAH
ncbi:MAG: hypothetical protein KC505_01080 [Myxococcales bacterium]|nr:hypothetical protein [Myxococcales bacterium]USN49901.1 MAG: ATP synthase subunit I [Myxococcales bacterium]